MENWRFKKYEKLDELIGSFQDMLVGGSELLIIFSLKFSCNTNQRWRYRREERRKLFFQMGKKIEKWHFYRNLERTSKKK